ncbi:MAG: Na+/H+ antiporter NhaC [Deltaproteobacteria bacterium]|jgi:NhaC family Na+:H+ antiporter|nr:Na+/H+ antiporter NhaC [Deltaproteobacteria bacterium]
MPKSKTSPSENPPIFLALIPVVFLVSSLYLTVIHFKQSPHIALLFSTGITALISRLSGIKWKTTLDRMVKSVKTTLGAIFLLMIVGILIGSWIQAGIVPALIYYGVYIVNPQFFLFTACLVSAIVSLATGSSWSTAGTIGLALMGLGKGLEIPPEMTAGAIISGAYFGDKMSPLSDTTNLAPAVAGTDLFTHIRHMIWTTGPSMILALAGYLILGQFAGGGPGTNSISSFTAPLAENFNITPFLFIPPLVVISLVATKRPALPSLFLGVVMGMFCSLIFQETSLAAVFSVAKNGFVSNTGNESMDTLLSRGGLASMMDTVALIITAVSFGGALEAGGFLKTITLYILKMVRGTGTLITATVFTAIGLNIMAGDQYIAIVLPGKMYKSTYKKFNLAPENLSRTLEDSATLTSPLIPWNTCGAFMWTTLGVFPLYYLPFAFLNLLNPIIAQIYGYTGFSIKKLD